MSYVQAEAQSRDTPGERGGGKHGFEVKQPLAQGNRLIKAFTYLFMNVPWLFPNRKSRQF
jgi:hypothetical protein